MIRSFTRLFPLLVILFSVCTLPVIGQKWETIDQIPGGNSESIYQDTYGFLWVGTTNGLYRYDGYGIQHFVNDPADTTSLPGTWVSSICEDSDRNIWLANSSAGVVKFERATNSFRKICLLDASNKCDSNIVVSEVRLDSNDIIWVGTNKGIYCLDSQGNTVDRYVAKPSDSTSLLGSYITEIYVDKHNDIWVGTYHGLNLLNRETGTFTNSLTSATYPRRQILEIIENPEGQIVVSPRFGDHCLVQYDRTSKRFTNLTPFSDRRLGEFRITYDHSGDLWISSRGKGAYQYNPETEKLDFFAPSTFAIHGYRNLYGLETITDKYGNIWVAGGFSLHKRPSSGKKFNWIKSDGNYVISVGADSEHIWYCSDRPYQYNRSEYTSEKYALAPSITNARRPKSWTQDTENQFAGRIYKYLHLDDTRMAILTTRNVYIYNSETQKIKEYASNHGGPFRDMAIDSSNSFIWICGNQGSPICFDLESYTFSQKEEVSSIKRPHTVEVSPDGKVFFGTRTSGLYIYDPDSRIVTNYSPTATLKRHRLSNGRIIDIEIAQDDRVWIATALGLNVLSSDLDSVHIYRVKDGLVGDQVHSLVESNDAAIWMGTNFGLSRLDPNAETFRHFSLNDGLSSTGYISRSSYQDSAGVLYFGGKDGLDYFDPSEIGLNSIAPDLYLSKILIDNNAIEVDTNIEEFSLLELEYDKYLIEIELLALHLTAPHANTYEYRIPEINNSWSDIGTRRLVTLSNSSPGTYSIEARAANADGVRSDAKLILTVVIRPPIWQTAWFIILASLLVLALLFLFYKIRVDKIKKEEKVKTTFERQIAQLEMKALRAQMNPHFLFNSLNSIKSLIVAEETAKATEYVTRFSQLIRQVLANTEQPTVRLQEDLNALRLYMEIERLRFQNFEYSIQVDDDVNVDFLDVPAMLLQPYVENAIWHGLLHKTDGDRQVSVNVSRDGDFLVMAVKDNGIGREQAKQIKMRGGSRKGGMGMRITKDRIRILQDHYGQAASVQVEDLYKENSTDSAGTRVTVRIPIPE